LGEKLYKALHALKISAKLIRLMKAAMKDTTAQMGIQTELTVAFQMKNGLKQGDRLATILFNLCLEYIIRKVPIATNSTVSYKSSQLVGDADDKMISVSWVDQELWQRKYTQHWKPKQKKQG
jgi:hypothetical protein